MQLGGFHQIFHLPIINTTNQIDQGQMDVKAEGEKNTTGIKSQWLPPASFTRPLCVFL